MHQNEEGSRTLEIDAEYVGPKSLLRLLKLPVTISAEDLFLSNKENELLILRNDLGDIPLLTAAEKGGPDTLQFLICCGTDILCHKCGNKQVTDIKLAWDNVCYENVYALLEAGSPFLYEFDLSDIEKCDKTATLLKQVENRQSLQKDIKES